MVAKRYSYIIPIVLSFMFLGSVAGIIGGSLTYNPTEHRNYYINNLEANEIDDLSFRIPDKFDRVNVELKYFITRSLDENNSLNFYLMDQQLPLDINTLPELLSSSYYSDSLISEHEDVSFRFALPLENQGDDIYVIVGNPSSNIVDISIEVILSSADGVTAQETIKILLIIFSSVSTLVFGVMAGYTWFEIFADQWYEPRVMTDRVESILEKTIEKAQSWELLLAGIATIMFVTGYSTWLIGLDSSSMIFALIAFGIIYYTYNSRESMKDRISTILKQDSVMELGELSEILDKSKEDTRSALMDMIIYDDFPATLDFKAGVVTYHPDRNSEIVSSDNNPVIKESKFSIAQGEVVSKPTAPTENDEESVKKMPTCPYCGAEAISHKAQFCHSCGASMSSAK